MARLTRQWRSILGRQATKVIRAKAGWARLGTLASEEVLDCATTLIDFLERPRRLVFEEDPVEIDLRLRGGG
jgi:hypothetical protein